MTVSAIIIFLYGGMVYGVIPNAVEYDVSWEAHLMGALVGLILAFYFRKFKITAEDAPSDPDDEDGATNRNSMNHTSGSDHIEIIYTYKPTKKSNQNRSSN